jgi:hypothetical protein
MTAEVTTQIARSAMPWPIARLSESPVISLGKRRVKGSS